MAAMDPVLINDAFRGYEDDTAGAITAQTAIAAVDTNWTQDVNVVFHVAMLVTETANNNGDVADRLEYNINSGGWNDVTTSTPIQSTTPNNCTTTNGTDYGTTALTTGGTTERGIYNTDGADEASNTLKNSSQETVWCLTIDGAQVSDGDTIQLRITNAGTAITDTTIPTITVNANVDVNANTESLTLTEFAATITNPVTSVDVQANTVFLGIVGGGNALLAEDGSTLFTEDGFPLATEDDDATITNPSSGTNVNANTESLTLTEFASTITVDVDVQAATEALTLTEFAASVANDIDVSAGPEALTLTEFAATVTYDVDVSAGPEALTLTEFAATVVYDVDVQANAEALTLTEFAASIGAGTEINANTEALTLTEFAATVAHDIDVSANTEALTLTEFAATVANDVDISANAEALTLTEFAATVAVDVDVQANAESLTITEFAASLGNDTNISANVEALTLTPQAATVANDVNVDAGPESLTLTEFAATVANDVNVDGNAEALTLTEFAATVALDVDISAGPESLTLTEHTASIGGGGTNVQANAEALSLTPQAALVETGNPTNVQAITAQLFVLPGNQGLKTEDGRILLSENAIPLLSEESRRMTVTYDVNVNANPEALTVTPQVAQIGGDQDIQANAESLTITPQAASVSSGAGTSVGVNTVRMFLTPGGTGLISEDGRHILAEDGTPLLTEEDRATVTFNRELVSAAAEALTITTQAATVALGTDTNVNAATELLDIVENDAGISSGPYIQTVAFDDSIDSWDIQSEDGTGTIVWAIVNLGATAPIPDGLGGWTGTVVDSGSDPFNTTISVATFGTPGVAYDVYVYQRTSGGADSNVITESYTENVVANTEALIFTTYTANLAPNAIFADTEALTITPQPATVRNDVAVSANVVSLTLTENTASVVSGGVNVSASAEVLEITAHQAAVAVDVSISAGVESLIITPQAANISASGNVFAENEALTITPQPADVAFTPSVVYSAASLTLTEYAAQIIGVRGGSVTPQNSQLTGTLASDGTLTGQLPKGELKGRIANG